MPNDQQHVVSFDMAVLQEYMGEMAVREFLLRCQVVTLRKQTNASTAAAPVQAAGSGSTFSTAGA